MSEATHPDAAPLYDLNAFQRDCLAVLAGMHKPKGLAIQDHLDDAYESKIRHSRLYPTLDDLAEMGLVDKGTKDRRTNEYSVTPRGRLELEAHQKWTANAMEGDL